MKNYTDIEEFLNKEQVFKCITPEELEMTPVPILDNAEGYFQLYKYYATLHLVENADNALYEAIRLDSDNIKYLKELGATHYPHCHLPNTTKATGEKSLNNAFDRLIELGVKTANIYHSRAKAFVLEISSMRFKTSDNGMDNIYKDLGYYDLALKDLNKAIELEPNNAEFYLTLGEFYQCCGRYGKALETYDKVLEINSYNAVVYYNKAQIYFENLNDDLKAMQELNLALNYDEYNPDAHWMKTLIYEKYNRNLEAISSIENYLKCTIDKRSYLFALDLKAELHHKEKEYKDELEALNLLILLDSEWFKIDYIKRRIKASLLNFRLHKIIPDSLNLLVQWIKERNLDDESIE